MSETKHTPGPWVNDAGAFYPAWALDEDGYNRKGYIAEMLNGYNESYHANAALIAAAPELLESLECLTAVLALKPKELSLQAIQEAYDIARAAIAKAKGEQP